MSAKRDPRLTLKLDGPKITSDHFARAINAFFDLLEEVSQQMTGSAKGVRWIITVEHGSDVLHAAPELINGASVRMPVLVDTISRGIRLLETRAQRPSHFSDSALRLTRELAKVPDGEDVWTAQVKSTDKPVSISRRAITNVSRILGEDIEEYGTVEGRLQTLSERRPHFALYDPLTDDAVRCNIKEDQVADAWRAFGRRVAVSGMIRYRKTGQPVSIEAESMYVYPPADELPTAQDVLGILADHDESPPPIS